jgi:ligand-binding sensor domain-containing protein/serine phosphatase RsbU (regulator of sigma subunit)
MRLSRYHIFLLIILIYSPLRAQDYLAPEVLSVEDGLSSRQVKDILVDRNGYLWAGTVYGLNRFDGYRFKNFFTTAQNDKSAGTRYILKVRCDNQGNLWILNQAGISRYDYKTGAITHYPISSFDETFLPGLTLTDLYPEPDGTVWLLTDKSLTSLSADLSQKTYIIPEDLLINGVLPTCLIADASKNLWIGTSSGLLLFDTQQRVFRELVSNNSQGLLSDNYVKTLFMDQDNFIWIGTKNGLNRVDPVDFAFIQYYPGGSQARMPANDIADIASAEKGAFVIASGTGITKFNNTSSLFTQVYTSSELKIESVAVDSTGIIWGGTSNGILKIRESPLSVQNYTMSSSGIIMDNSSIIAVAQGLQNNFFIGFDRNGYSIVDSKTMKRTHFNTLDGSNVVNFYPFRQGEFLVLSEHGIEVVSAANAERKSLASLYPFLDKLLMEKESFTCLFYNGDNELWLGTSTGIQHIKLDSAYHVSKHKFEYQNQQLYIGYVHSLVQDPIRNVWIGTESGLLYYNPAKGNFNKYTPYDISLMNTEHKAVFTIVPEKSDVFWLGTSGGIFRFDAASREFTSLDVTKVINSSIRVLALDAFSNLWFSTEAGLFHYLKASNILKIYDQKEGLLNETYTAITASSDGKMYLAGPMGLSIVKATETIPVAAVRKVVITGVQIIDNDPEQQDLYNQLPDTIYLPWSRKPLQIDFAVLDFSRPEWNHFRYSFGNTNREPVWIELGTLNHVVLNHLSPGKHIFRVTGSNADMNWNSTGASLVIVVETPYWRSRIGLALIVLAGLFLVFFFFRFWIRQFFNLSRENREREMFARQIMLQKEELTLKNKSITDSINYAKRIQTAMLPPIKLFKSIFPSSFILFMPKDIVSGDFYWVNKLGNKIFISAVDCTGHGVPGAFMSIIGFELFRKITNIEGLSRPSDILNRLNDDFHEIFKDVDNVVLRDGMDVAFCSIDKKDMILEFAGAFNPLYIIRENKITEVKGDRFAIGLDETNFKDQTFKNHLIPIQKGDIIYIFSDGFADQFGGPDGKKYKYRRFRHLLLNLHQLPMEKQHEILENNVLEWRGEQDQVDDILVIGIKIDF